MTIQMFQLVAVAAGRQALPLHLEPLSVPVLSTDPHVIGPGYQPPFAGNAEAALRAGLFSALRNDGRINESANRGFNIFAECNAAD